MAELVIEGDDVVLRLTRGEKVGAFHGDVRVPRVSVLGARVSEKPITDLRGLRMPGTAWPKPLVAMGTWWRRDARRDFVMIHGKDPVVVIDLDERSPRFGRLIVSVADPARVIDLLQPS